MAWALQAHPPISPHFSFPCLATVATPLNSCEVSQNRKCLLTNATPAPSSCPGHLSPRPAAASLQFLPLLLGSVLQPRALLNLHQIKHFPIYNLPGAPHAHEANLAP